MTINNSQALVRWDLLYLSASAIEGKNEVTQKSRTKLTNSITIIWLDQVNDGYSLYAYWDSSCSSYNFSYKSRIFNELFNWLSLSKVCWFTCISVQQSYPKQNMCWWAVNFKQSPLQMISKLQTKFRKTCRVRFLASSNVLTAISSFTLSLPSAQALWLMMPAYWNKSYTPLSLKNVKIIFRLPWSEQSV